MNRRATISLASAAQAGPVLFRSLTFACNLAPVYSNLDNQIRSRLRLRHLELLELIGDGHGVHTAAARLNLTQPAISKMLQDIEAIYGAKLFNRMGRKLHATQAGSAAISCARQLLSGVDESIAEVRLIASGHTGLVRVGSMTVSAPQVLVASMAALLKREPNIRIQVIEGGAHALMQGLAREELDVVLTRIPALAYQPPFAFEPLYGHDEMCLVCRPAHPLTLLDSPTVAALGGLQWIFPLDPAPIRMQVAQMLAAAQVEFIGPTVEAASMAIFEELVAATDMVAPLPRHLAESYRMRGTLAIVAIPLCVQLPPIGLIWNTRTQGTPATDMLKDAIRTAAATLLPPSAP
jgi:DNA-binding transcriptional LysR family regulator